MGGKLITSDGTLKKGAFNQNKESQGAPSAESMRPLLNSSESSICDACCEIARCSASAMDCWMSTESCHLDALSVAASEAGGENGCPLKVWVPEVGAYLVDRVALLERCTEKTLLSPKWQDGDTNEDKNNGKMADVLSLSSHDSNSSSSEYSVPRTYVDSYYDKPRNVIGSLISSEGPLLPPRSPAKVKNEHKTTPTKTRNVSAHRQVENSTEGSRNLPVGRCGYVWDNPAYAKTPGSTNGTPLGTPIGSPKKSQPTCNSPTKMRASVQLNLMSPSRRGSTAVTPSSAAVTPSACSCCQCESKLNPYGDYSIPRTALAHLFLKEHQVASVGGIVTSTTPSSTSTSAATTPSVDKTSCSTRTSLMSSDSSGDYDIPRRVKDCLAAADAKENQSSLTSGSCLGLTLHACTCGLKARSNTARHISSACPCVRVANWAEHFVPCKQQQQHQPLAIDDAPCTHRRAILEAKLCGRNETQVKNFVHQHSCLCPESHEGNEWVSRPPVDPTTKPQQAANLTPCTTQPTADPTSTLKWSSVKGSSQMANYVNVDVGEKPGDKTTPAKTRDARVNYANLDFVDSLPLYENTGSVLSRENALTDEQNKTTTSRCTSCGHNFVRVDSGPVSRPSSAMDGPKQYRRDSEDGNYLLMQPVSGRCTPLNTPSHQSMTLPRDRKSIRNSESSSDEQLGSPGHCEVSSEYIRMSDLAKDIKSLPLRPFLPLQISSRWKDFDLIDLDFFRSRSCSSGSENGGKCMNRSLSLEPQSGRSHSVVELQKEVFLRKRSSSADGRRGLRRTTTTAELEISMRALMTFVPRRSSLLSRLSSVGSQSKSQSSEECSSRSPRHHSSESLSKQDVCDVEVVLRNLEMNARTDASPTNIKRSSSVPCNPGNRDSASSSDSGVSTGSPKQAPAFPTASDNTYMEMSMVKAGNAPSTDEAKLLFRLKRHETDCKSVQSEVADADPVWIKREDLKDVSPNHEIVVHPCFVDSKSNSSASDMSDYIETLSLSSHGSSDVPRVDDGPRLPNCITSTLRPRSGREYQMLDRALLEECFLHQSVDPNTGQQIPPSRGDSLTPGLRCEKPESPSPGYGSGSSPADIQRADSNSGKQC